MDNKTKLTSVNILTEVYKKFKINSIEESINLQKLVNRALDLYNSDDEFKQKINNHTGLSSTNSKF
jgi:hypothetical protein